MWQCVLLLDRPTTGPLLPTSSVSHVSYASMRLEEAALCEACDCLSGFSLCVCGCRVRVCACLPDGWRINILSVLESMLYKILAKARCGERIKIVVGTRFCVRACLYTHAANASGLLSVPAIWSESWGESMVKVPCLQPNSRFSMACFA